MANAGSFVAIDTKAVTETGSFEGYASVFGNVDRTGDIVVSGAFAKTLNARPAAKVKMLRDHDSRQLIGMWTEAREDKRGLFVKGQLLLDVASAKEAHTLMKAGVLDGLSIGYRTVRDRWDSARKARYLEELDLVEVSLTAFPANERATVANVKNEDFARRVVAAIERAAARVRAA